eukprot:scaffold277393_cov23-Tisochrysis_lutea.AAC.1
MQHTLKGVATMGTHAQVCQVNTLLTLLNGYLKGVSEAGQQLDAKRMEKVFLFCVTWALGGLLDIKLLSGAAGGPAGHQASDETQNSALIAGAHNSKELTPCLLYHKTALKGI